MYVQLLQMILHNRGIQYGRILAYTTLYSKITGSVIGDKLGCSSRRNGNVRKTWRQKNYSAVIVTNADQWRLSGYRLTRQLLPHVDGFGLMSP